MGSSFLRITVVANRTSKSEPKHNIFYSETKANEGFPLESLPVLDLNQESKKKFTPIY